MRVSLDWLNDYVKTEGHKPEEISEALTNAGLEVEEIETLGGQFSGVIVGKAVKVEQHPNADRLRLVTVNLGDQGENQVVCGAPNVAEGLTIAYAQIGAKVLNRKDNTLFELQPAKIRGVESTGMICSVGELGLEEQYPPTEDGIWPLNALVSDADLGKDLKEVLDLNADIVLDVAPTANRGDLMSMHGVAREVAALFNLPLSIPEPPQPKVPESAHYKVKLEDKAVCAFYAGAVLKNVKLGPAPEWMRQRLTAAGIRTINNVVDITNYVMLEYGQPLHAFDIEKLGASGTVGVRFAKSGETLKSLDGVERPLTEQSVAVTFNDKAVALAGVMGGEDTEIDDNTQNVFLEAAFFPSAVNRRSGRSVGLRTESSARFERGVDPARCEVAFYRAIELLVELCGATLESVTQDDHRLKRELDIPLSLTRMKQILGITIPEADIRRTLNYLGFEVTAHSTPETFLVRVPSFRSEDVSREIDIIEEITRIYGYDSIPYTLPLETTAPVISLRARLLDQLRLIFAGQGLSEVYTHSLIGDGLLKRTGFTQDEATTVKVSNSQSIDHTFLRQSLLPNLLEIAKHNQAQGNEDIWLFELGKTYFKRKPATEKESGVEEALHVSGLICNSPRSGVWHQTVKTDFYTAKGLVENLLAQLQLSGQARWMAESEVTSLHPGQSARIKLGKTELGLVGRLHPLLEEEMKFKAPVYVFELNVEALYAAIQKKPEVLAVESLSAFPSVKRDMAFMAPLEVTHQKIASTINQLNEPLLQSLELFDEYRGEQLGEGNRSLAYRMTLQSQTGTLTEQEIDAAVDKVKKQLTDQLAVTFR